MTTTTTPLDQLTAQVDPLLDNAAADVSTAYADAAAALRELASKVAASHAAAVQLDDQFFPHLGVAPDPRAVVPPRLREFASDGRGTTFHAVGEALAAAVASVDRGDDQPGPGTGFNDQLLAKRAATFAARYGIEVQA